MTPETVDELMACPDVDGCLIGGASLAADKVGGLHLRTLCGFVLVRMQIYVGLCLQ